MSKVSNLAVKVSDLSKRYLIGKKKDGSLRGTLASLFKTGNSSEEEFWALKNINFEIEKGGVIGIIGRNGAGKSTLLKLLSQITSPTTGRIEINGRVASLLEVGTGFHPELTGRENIFLNGTILGMSRKEVTSKFDEIVAFSGIEKFIDTPVKRYSSGMYVRLAFSVAAHLEPEILIIDEVLAVGDAEFQKKCLGKMKDVAGEGRTVLFVSHNIAAIKSLCTKGIVLTNGELSFIGNVDDAIANYQSSTTKLNDLIKNFEKEENARNEFIDLKTIEIKSDDNLLTISKPFNISISFLSFVPNINLDCTVELKNEEETVVFHTGALISTENDSKTGKYTVSFTMPSFYINAGGYYINLIFGKNQREALFTISNCFTFRLENDKPLGSNSNKLPGVLRPNFNFDIIHEV